MTKLTEIMVLAVLFLALVVSGYNVVKSGINTVKQATLKQSQQLNTIDTWKR